MKILNSVGTRLDLLMKCEQNSNGLYRCLRLTYAATLVETRMATKQTAKILESMTDKDVGDSLCEGS